MITQLHRFHGHGSLRFVYGRGQTIRGSLVSLKFVRNQRRSTYRVAIVVSKKVSKSAVVRNRIRRRMYEIVRTEVAEGNPYDLVFTAFSEQLAELPPGELRRAVVAKLKAAHLETAKTGGKTDGGMV